MAEGGELPQDDTDLTDSEFKKSKKLNEILNNQGLSEENVAKRRQLVQLYNIALNIPKTIYTGAIGYLSGSAAEGVVSLYDKRSDIDIMSINPFNVIDDDNEANQLYHFPLQKGVYALEDSIPHPLYKRLRHIRGGDSRQLYQHSNGYKYLSHAEMKRKLFNTVTSKRYKNKTSSLLSKVSVEIHGPAVNEVSKYKIDAIQADTDFVVTVPCPFWPKEINGWFLRKRGCQWPSSSTIQTIRSIGCHLVGKGFDNSAEYEIEWRISFSMTENILIHSFNNTQLKCYYLMKTLLKRIIKPRYPNILCSYHMKTVMFWVCEETCPTLFKKSALVKCFHFCVNKLISFLLQNHCHCYFRKDVNLFANHVGATTYINIAQFLCDLMKQGDIDFLMPYLSEQPNMLQILQDSNENSKVFNALMVQSFTFINMHSYINSIRTVNNAITIQNIVFCSILNLTNRIFNLLRLDLSYIKILSNRIVPDLCCVALSALFRRQKNNKDHYRLQKHYISLMSCDISVESSASVLKRATVYYKLGKINECMVLVVSVIEKISSSSIIYSGLDPCKCPMAFLKPVLSPDVPFRISPSVNFSPLEMPIVPEFICLEMDFEKPRFILPVKGWAFMDSIIYAYCLAILCQHYISDFNTRDDFLQQLQEFYLRRNLDLSYPDSAERALNYFHGEVLWSLS